MAIDLTKYGITGTTEVVYNPSYEVLFEEETKAGLEGYEVGQNTELDTVNVMTGVFTGRSPKDKFIVDTDGVHNEIAWGKVNRPISREKFDSIPEKCRLTFCTRKPDGYQINHPVFLIFWSE